jgi:hypothetical protein
MPTVSLRSDGIIHVDYGDLRHHSVDVYDHIYRERKRLVPEGKVPILLTSEQVLHVERDAFDRATQPQFAESVACLAVVTHGFLVRHYMRIFIWYHHPPYPVRVFGNAPDAVAWLRETCKLP